MTQPRPPDPTRAFQLIKQIANRLGFALVGLAPARPTDHSSYIRKWLAKGKHGEMAYLATNVATRLDPAQLLPGAKSIICVADRHVAEIDDRGVSDGEQRKETRQEQRGKRRPEVANVAQGRIARYAWGNDYHKIIKKRLHIMVDQLRQHWPDERYLAAVDTAPILERDHAQRAALGWIGKHTLLIHPRQGSWLLLGQIITTLTVDPNEPHSPISDHCGTCTRCIDACPTKCIDPRGYRLDASQCISYLTIEHRGLIDPALHSRMGDWIAGCDVCQEVCPFNSGTEQKERTAQDEQRRTGGRDCGGNADSGYEPRPPAPSVPLLELLGWDAEARQRAFVGSALKRIKLDSLKRNALIAAGNYLTKRSDTALRARIEELADDENESKLVRLTAQKVMARWK